MAEETLPIIKTPEQHKPPKGTGGDVLTDNEEIGIVEPVALSGPFDHPDNAHPDNATGEALQHDPPPGGGKAPDPTTSATDKPTII